MANSTTNLDTISSSDTQKEVKVNSLLDAASPATHFGRRASTSGGLAWGYYSGTVIVDGVATQVANGTLTLANGTNYIERTRAGAVSSNTTGFTAGRIPLYTATGSGGVVTAWTDHRSLDLPIIGRTVQAMANANQTLNADQARCQILEATGALTLLRDLIVPLAVWQWTVFANVTGGFGIRVIAASGTGITIADGKRAIVYCDGTNVVRVTADT